MTGPAFRFSVLFAVLSVCFTGSAAALDLALPQGARLTVERNTDLDSFDAPVAGFDGQEVPSVTVEGMINRRAWRIASADLTPLQVIVPLRAQMEEMGYDLIFECASTSCGGFDFRFAVEVLPGPNMYVNISSFRYLTALRGPRDAPREVVSILVSATAASAYVQVIEAISGSEASDGVSVTPQPVEESLPSPPSATKMISLLERGFIVLEDLDFGTGTSELGTGPHASLQELADLLLTRGDLRIALVGHTDAVGGLEANLALSRARAQAVRDRLVDEYGVDRARLDAEGIAYLGPVASNLTEAGRQLNRRVEAVLLNTQ